MTASPRLVIALFFLVSGGVVAAAVYSAVESPRLFGLGFGEGCNLDVTGAAPAPQDEQVTARAEGGRWTATRVLTYRLPALAAGEVGLCADTGGVTLEAGSAEAIVVEAKVHGYATSEQAARDAAQRLTPEVRSLPDAVWAWHPAGGARLAQGVGATLSLRVVVPAAMLVEADLGTDTGSIKVRDVRLTGFRANADTGGIQLDPASARGRLVATTDTGGIHARFPQLEAATMRFEADTGSIDVAVPAGARHGYDVAADTDTGAVLVALPGMEDIDRGDREHRHVRTTGFADREVQVTIAATADTGSVSVGVA